MNTSVNLETNSSSDHSKEADNAREKFLFDCDFLLLFCTNMESTDLADQTDTMLEIKLEDLEKRWVQVQTSFQNLMLSAALPTSKDFKENAKVNFNACSEAYYTAYSQIWDLLRITNSTSTQRTSRLSLALNDSSYKKLSPIAYRQFDGLHKSTALRHRSFQRRL